jgi:hypothetical protein
VTLSGYAEGPKVADAVIEADEAMQLIRSQSTLADEPRPAFYPGRKLSDVEQALVWSVLQEDPECPSRVLLDKLSQRQIALAVSLRHVNRWRVTWGLNRGQGRPRQAGGHRPGASGAEVVRVTPHVACVGVHLFAHWLDQHDAFGPVVAQLTQAVEAHKPTHPEDDFALLHHRASTLVQRFEALVFAP